METSWPLPPQGSLDRFLEAQAGRQGPTYDGALAELRAGRKTSHWIWFVLPQLRLLGRSQMAACLWLSLIHI